MKKSLKNNKIVFFDIDYTLFDCDIFKKSNLKDYKNYDETEVVLKNLSKKTDLGIFSEGEENLQKAKLYKTGIGKYFTQGNVYILQGKNVLIEETFEKYRGNSIYLVEDKLEILNQVKSVYPDIFTVWVKRGIYAEKQGRTNGFMPDAQILNLNELINIIL